VVGVSLCIISAVAVNLLRIGFKIRG